MIRKTDEELEAMEKKDLVALVKHLYKYYQQLINALIHYNGKR